jgi:predicted nucleotidyltransferase
MEAIRSPLLRRVLSDYRTRLEARFGPRLQQVRQFGSWARGEANEHSDVDVAVVVDDLTHEEWGEAVRMAAEIDLDEGTGLSPYAVSTAHFDALV